MAIGSFSGVIERLVALLANHVAPNVQGSAAYYKELASLSGNVDKNVIKIGYFPGAIDP